MLDIKNITKYYGSQPALDHISLHAGKGEIVGLLGPNGAGKSTLMKIITCYIPPSEGNATVCGHSIYDDPVAVRRCIGYLPEHNPLYLEMYVREFLQFAAGIFRLDRVRERVDEIITRTGLTPEANKKIGQLSKGYRQRVGLAQALIHDPEVLILDEPTTGLDPNQLEEIRALIRTVGSQKVVLLSTHIMQEVEAMCSRAVIINRGRIVSDDQMAHITSQQLTERFHRLTVG
ncbi:MAG: protein involved in gliding motility GldA [bacterium P3]|nr:MAG: protein involved in gliding motility GldA [bacterium P3]KWW40997.1 MAG: protein involved in gliding motility GldA [bacterium F083]